MPIYTWKNKATGETVEVIRPMAECDVPPSNEGEWERVYSFGVGRIEGAGGSPARPSVNNG